MFRSFSRSWELVKTSFSILRQDKELLIFPLMSGIALLLITATFAVPFFVVSGSDIAMVILAFVYYVVTSYVAIFANAAVAGAALMRLQGEDPTFNDAFSAAQSRADKIFGWALISATVGMVLQALRDDDNVIGNIVLSIIGVAWSVATFLVVPILVAENVGPIEAIKRSSAMLRQTFGQQIIGNFSISGVFFLLFLAGVIPLALVGFALSAIAPVLVIPVVIAGVLFVLALVLVSSAVSGIFTAAVYAYASNDVQIDNQIFDTALVQNAFRTR
jgi:hypothetical protein